MRVKYSGYARLLFCVAGLVAALTHVSAIAVRNPEFGYSVDLPIGWTDSDSSDPYHIALLSPAGDAMLQIISLDPATSPDAAGIADTMLAELQTDGEHAQFSYLDRSATLTDVMFVTSGNEVRGYMLAIDTFLADYVLLSFALIESYETAHDHLLSALDSFALDDVSRLYPGPISVFMGTDPSGGDRRTATTMLPFASGFVEAPADPAVLETAALLVEREARILAPYGALDRAQFEAAWRRYFRQIYRESYQHLAPVAEAVDRILRSERVGRVDYPHEVLAWLQGFEYERTGGLSDFSPPVVCLNRETGDCDSLALTYVILMHHLGFDAIVMVSDRYAHAVAAVDVPGPGARFPFEDREWLVAELTADVALGQIAQTMADPAGWLGVRLRLISAES